MADEGHFGPASLDSLHTKHRQSGTEGGACLTGHDPSFSKHNNQVTCNYRFQAWKQAQAHGGIESALHSYSKITISSTIKTSAWKKNKPEYCGRLPKPRPGDWDITGPTAGPVTRTTFAGKKVTIPAGMNFTQELWPYWNNAHHLIPKGTLKAKITEQSARVSTLIQKALLTAQYNINHKTNMLLMPQDKRVAEILGLPRHIQLRDKDAPGLAPICGNHPVWNDMTCTIRSGLTSIVNGYKKICDDAIDAVKGTHKVPKPSLDKTKLEKLSERLLKLILGAQAAGHIDEGQSLDALADAL
jgi:hypothetical protein